MAAAGGEPIADRWANCFHSNNAQYIKSYKQGERLKKELTKVRQNKAACDEDCKVNLIRLCALIGMRRPDEREDALDQLKLPQHSPVAVAMRAATTCLLNWRALYDDSAKTTRDRHAHYAVSESGFDHCILSQHRWCSHSTTLTECS